MELTTFRSYHGPDAAKAIQYYWQVTEDVAKAVAAEMNAIDWPEDDKIYQQAKWLRDRLK